MTIQSPGRRGRHVRLDRSADTNTGATQGSSCSSDLRGASYATSEVKLDGQGIQSWDRGFSADGKQAWGATRGPYLFERAGD